MRFGSIDFFRGVAVILVVFFHAYIAFNLNDPGYPSFFLKYVPLGQYGVQMFFILSAFTLCNSFQQSISISEKNRIRNFYIRRFFRIYPLFFVLLVLLLFVRENNGSPTFIFLNFLFVNNIYPPIGNMGIVPFSWTLNVEMLFYLLFPFLFSRLLPSKWLIFLPVVFYSFYIVCFNLAHQHAEFLTRTFGITHAHIDAFGYRNLLSQISVFMLGFILYRELLGKRKDPFSFSNLFIFALLVVNLLHPIQHPFLVVSYAWYFLIYLLFEYDFRKLILNPIRRIGVCSYNIYLLHFFGIKLVQYFNLDYLTGNQMLDHLIRFVIILLFAWGIGEISRVVIEKPGIALGKKLIRL